MNDNQKSDAKKSFWGRVFGGKEGPNGEELLQHCEELSDELASMRDVLDAAEARCDELTAVRAELNQSLIEERARITRLEQEKHRHIKERNDARRDADAHKKSAEENRRDADRLNKELTSIRAKLKTTERRLAEVTRAEETARKKSLSLETVAKERDRLVKELERARATAEEAKRRSEQQVTSLRNELTETRAKSNELASDVKRVREAAARLHQLTAQALRLVVGSRQTVALKRAWLSLPTSAESLNHAVEGLEGILENLGIVKKVSIDDDGERVVVQLVLVPDLSPWGEDVRDYLVSATEAAACSCGDRPLTVVSSPVLSSDRIEVHLAAVAPAD